MPILQWRVMSSKFESCLCLMYDLTAACAWASQDGFVNSKSIASFYFLSHSSMSCCSPQAAAALRICAHSNTDIPAVSLWHSSSLIKFYSNEKWEHFIFRGMAWFVLEVIKKWKTNVYSQKITLIYVNALYQCQQLFFTPACSANMSHIYSMLYL